MITKAGINFLKLHCNIKKSTLFILMMSFFMTLVPSFLLRNVTSKKANYT